MPLPFDMLQAAVRISSLGELLGTGFLVRVLSDADGYAYSYIVTPHHVIRGQIEVKVEIPSPFANGALYPPVDVDNWDQPLPDVDLAIAPYAEADDRNHFAVWSQAIWPGVPDLGHHIFYVGIFQPLDRPMARSGTIGAIEQGAIPHSKGRYTFPAHLVDCRSYRGFSGSPCWMELPLADLSGKKGVPPWVPDDDLPVARLNYYTILCGMFTSHFSEDDDPDAVSRYGVGVMLPARLILEGLMTEKAQQQRRDWDNERAVQKAKGEPRLQDAGGIPSAQSGEFERFEDLTEKLLRVPKKELDERRGQES